jgi:hypothetical protein
MSSQGNRFARSSRASLTLAGFLAAAAAVAGGCTAGIAGGGQSDDDPGAGGHGGDGGDGGDNIAGAQAACDTVGPAPLRRLSRSEHWATLRDLFPGVALNRPTVTPDPVVQGFENRADKLFATENNVNDFATAAVSAAEKAVANLNALIACASTGDANCGRKFIVDFGLRAFRRPLDDAETTRYAAAFEKNRAALGFKQAAQLTIEAMLQSVNFLYRTDLGDPGTAQDGRQRLGGYEVASRLSYLLWGTMPDNVLFDAAAGGDLSSDEQIVAQAERMLGDDRARGQLVDFHRQWLNFEHVNDVFLREGNKDTEKYPEYTAELRAAMREESDRFTELVMGDGTRSLAELLQSRETFVNAPLAKLYGVSGPGSGWQRVTLPEDQRAGFLTRGAFLAGHAHKHAGSPPLRAVYVMRRMLCMPEMTPSADADTSEPVPSAGEPRTNRELFEARVGGNSSCQGCHKIIDPIGFTFEGYDAIGRHRTEDNGQPVNARGALAGSDVDDEVDNAIGLSAKLAESQNAQACLAGHWLAFATGMEPEKNDCRVNRLARALASADGDVHALLLTLVKSPDFLTVPSSP